MLRGLGFSRSLYTGAQGLPDAPAPTPGPSPCPGQSGAESTCQVPTVPGDSTRNRVSVQGWAGLPEVGGRVWGLPTPGLEASAAVSAARELPV